MSSRVKHRETLGPEIAGLIQPQSSRFRLEGLVPCRPINHIKSGLVAFSGRR